MLNNLKLSDLDELEAAEKAATPGPWTLDDGSCGFWWDEVDPGWKRGFTMEADAICATLARNNTPALVAALRGALQVMEALNRHSYPLRGSVTYDDLIAELDEFRNDNPGLLPETGE